MKTKSFMKKMTVCLCSAAMAAMMPVCSAAAEGLTFGGMETFTAQSTPYKSAQANSSTENSNAADSAYRIKNQKGTASNNVQINGYNGSYHASPIKSYLYEWKGNLYRLEYTGGKIILEKYDSDLKYIGKGEIEAELPVFGGFYSGKDYNYIIFGEKNLSESNSKEIMRVVKYSKGMNRLSAKSFYGCNTYIPFDAGCPRMDEYNGILYIHACHEMYKSSDGYNHQANMDFYIKTSDMSTVYSRYDVSNVSTGYMSHSFNQFIKVNSDGIYTLDHGDAYNRALTAFRRESAKSKYAGHEDVFKIKGKTGQNYTGVCVGGMEISSKNMLIAGTSVPQDGTWGNSSQKNLFVICYPLYAGGKETTRYFTNYKESDNVTFSEPKLVEISKDKYALIWSETKNSSTVVKFAMLDGSGEKIGDIQSYSGKVSDCQPIIYNNKIVYYVTENDAPVFYRFDID